MPGIPDLSLNVRKDSKLIDKRIILPKRTETSGESCMSISIPSLIDGTLWSQMLGLSMLHLRIWLTTMHSWRKDYRSLIYLLILMLDWRLIPTLSPGPGAGRFLNLRPWRPLCELAPVVRVVTELESVRLADWLRREAACFYACAPSNVQAVVAEDS